MKDRRFIFLKFSMDSLAHVHDSSFPTPPRQLALTVTPGKALKLQKQLFDCYGSFNLCAKPDEKSVN